MKKFLVLLFIVFFPAISVYAQTNEQRLNELRRVRDAARTEVRGTQNLLQGLRSEMAELLAEMQRYDQMMVDALEASEDIEFALLDTQIRIDASEQDLLLAQQDRDVQYEVLRARMRAMHESGPVGMLEVLFQAASFSEFLMRMEYVRAVSAFDQQVLDRLENAESRVIGHIETLNRERNLIESLYFQQQIAIQALRDAEEVHLAWLESLHENEERLNLILEMQAEEQRALDVEFGNLEAVVRAERAEAERLAREEQQRQAREQEAARLAHLAHFDGAFLWPVPTTSRISSPFGPRTNPITRRSETHRGIDIPAPTGTRINAAADGVVRLAAWHGGYGLTVIIDHGNGYSTLYAHNSRNLVSPGDNVTRGQHIANIGSTGQSTGPHLHFEIRRNGTAINPAPLVGR